jgi:hypothetical protein
VHDEPNFQRVLYGVRQHGNEFGRAAGDILLATANADAGAQRRQLNEVAVAAEAEILARQSPSEIACAAKDRLSRSKPMTQWLAKSASERGSPKRAR